MQSRQAKLSQGNTCGFDSKSELLNGFNLQTGKQSGKLYLGNRN